ncbi:hypothetical protein OIDMADRAFT_146080 [Oidiodendron maius Zn]|uniref:Uncharacterized protein n=1 Tax=Oidiodendron maius (strain Zn) TaxID=913774 RepID=A0A0C3HEF8_OIDMZ|nr:hypothetical protein OIDMADRAFT_146080 [Oidiodendron maius Zn]
MADELNFPSSCHTCEPIDLKKYLYKKIHDAIPLGSWSRIKSQDNCGLCWLVVQAIRLRGLDLDGDTVISLLNRMSWKQSEAKSEYDQVYFTTPSNRGDLKAQAVADAIETGHFAYLSPSSSSTSRTCMGRFRQQLCLSKQALTDCR